MADEMESYIKKIVKDIEKEEKDEKNFIHNQYPDQMIKVYIDRRNDMDAD